MSLSHFLCRTSLALALASSPLAVAQPVQLLDCTEINLLAQACDEAIVEEKEASLPPQAPTPPLFTLQTMRPDTPPLLLKVFNEPTDANIQAFLEWEQRYLSRAFEVEALLKRHRQERKR